jgi:hypothetical protein
MASFWIDHVHPWKKEKKQEKANDESQLIPVKFKIRHL